MEKRHRVGMSMIRFGIQDRYGTLFRDLETNAFHDCLGNLRLSYADFLDRYVCLCDPNT